MLLREDLGVFLFLADGVANTFLVAKKSSNCFATSLGLFFCFVDPVIAHRIKDTSMGLP